MGWGRRAGLGIKLCFPLFKKANSSNLTLINNAETFKTRLAIT